MTQMKPIVSTTMVAIGKVNGCIATPVQSYNNLHQWLEHLVGNVIAFHAASSILISQTYPPVTLICRPTAGRSWRRSIIKSCPFGLRLIAARIA